MPPWQGEQQPRVRGVEQNRITVVTGASVPGSGINKPTGAMRVELRPYHNNDIVVTATADATSTATTLSLSNADAALLADRDFLHNARTGEMLRVNGIPSETTVTVSRAQNTTAAAILAGDTFTVPCGDVNDSGGSYATSRSEVYGRFANFSTDDPTTWPDSAGSERWYSWSIYLTPDYPTHEDVNLWESIMQIKGQFGGSPPLALELYHSTYRLGGTKGLYTGLGGVRKGQWDTFAFGIKLSPNPAVGWIEVWRNGIQVMARRTQATMDYKSDGVTPDPIYIKQGVYRDTAWAETHIAYYSPLIVASNSVDVGIAQSPNVVPGTLEYWGAGV